MTPLRRLQHAVAFLARGGVLAIAGNLSLAAISVALALSLWLYVTDRENPQKVETFNSAIPVQFVNVPNGHAVANASASNVRIQIAAPQNQLKQLHPDDFEATVNLGGLANGTTSLPVDVTSSNGSVDVTDVTPGRIDVTIEDLQTKQVPVKINVVGSPQLGFQPGSGPNDQKSDPTSVTVSGPASLVALVDSVTPDANISGLRVNFDQNVDLTPRDVRGGEISRVSSNPAKARVSIALVQHEFTSTFGVTANLRGAPAAGYNTTGVTVDPPFVAVTGAADVLQSIDAVAGVSTAEISLADQRADVVRQVGLQLTPGTRTASVSAVTVHVSISPARGEQSFSVVPRIQNVGAGLSATPAQGAIIVTLSGDVAPLQALTSPSIVVTVDASGLGPGLYALPLAIQAPPGTQLVRSDPGQLGVAIAARP